MNFFDYAFHHVGCVVRIVRGDAGALSDMDISADGFWRSFEAIIAALPALLFAWVVEARQIQMEGIGGSMASLVSRLAFLELVFWVLPIIALAVVLPPLGFGKRFSQLIIARNWLSAAISYLYVLVPMTEFALSSGAENEITPWLTLAIMIIMIWAAIRVTRVALATTGIVAFAFVFAETLVTFPLAISLYGLMGLYPPA
jgi:hypothetical protein